MKGFVEFIREQGVVGFAVGFILGGAISKMVSSLVNDVLNPLLGILLGATGELANSYLQIASVKIMWGSFLGNFIDFLVISMVVYLSFKILKLDKLDKKK